MISSYNSLVLNKLRAFTFRQYPWPHSATLVVSGHTETLDCVSEVGRYGICFADHGQVKSNKDVGYLVRTKAENINEGGVCAGYACLNSLMLKEGGVR